MSITGVLAVVGSFLFILSDSAETTDSKVLLDGSSIALHATSTTPVYDERIAALWIGHRPPGDQQEMTVHRQCTASRISEKLWISSLHCVSHNLSLVGYLERSDGEYTGIENIYTLTDRDDIALIKAGDGIDGASFSLPEQPLRVGDLATLIGYAMKNPFSSAAQTRITGRIDEKHFGTASYKDIYEARSVTPSWTCQGDSGGAIYVNDTIYAVHSGGSGNPHCQDGVGKLMWHTDIFSRTDWIQGVINNDTDSSEEEKQRGINGESLRKLAQDDPIPRATGSSLSSAKGALPPKLK